MLQSAELNGRDVSAPDQGIVTLQQIDNTQYDIVGIPSLDSSRMAWLLTNSQNIPIIKILPDLRPRRISQDEFNEIVGSLTCEFRRYALPSGVGAVEGERNGWREAIRRDNPDTGITD